MTRAALNAQANPTSACDALATKYLTALTNDKNNMDAMLGASSCSNQLPISSFKTSAALNVPANPASACSALATKYLPAHTNDKNYMDAMLGASSRSNQLRISFKSPSSSQAPSVSATSPPRSVPTLAACST